MKILFINSLLNSPSKLEGVSRSDEGVCGFKNGDKSAINSENGDKVAINTKNGDKSAINSEIGDKSAEKVPRKCRVSSQKNNDVTVNDSENDRVNVQENEKSSVKTTQKSSQKSDLKSSLKSDLKSDLKILEMIRNNPYITIPELCEQTVMSRSGIKKVLGKLKNKNLIRRIGPDKGGHWEIIEK